MNTNQIKTVFTATRPSKSKRSLQWTSENHTMAGKYEILVCKSSFARERPNVGRLEYSFDKENIELPSLEGTQPTTTSD